MTKVPRLQPVYASINKPLTIGGADRRLFFVALVVAGATFTLFGSLLTGLGRGPGLFLGARGAPHARVPLPHRHAGGPFMRPLSQIVQDFRDTGAMSTLINLYGFVDDVVFLT